MPRRAGPGARAPGAIGAGLPLAVGCTTVNKMCGSGMKAAMLANDLIETQSVDLMVPGGMESMTNAPYLLPKARAGLRMGHGQVIDHMFYDASRTRMTRGASWARLRRIVLRSTSSRGRRKTNLQFNP